jgi:hypothetical protein
VKHDEEAAVAVADSVKPVKPLLRGWMHLLWFEACLSRLRVRRRHVPVRRDSAVHRLTRWA